jgi:hypothetical protein
LDNEALRIRLGAAGRTFAAANWDREVVLQRLLTELG